MLPFRSPLFALALVILAVPSLSLSANAEELLGAIAPTLSVRESREFHRNLPNLHRACRTRHQIRACTDVVAERLHASCVEVGSEWRVAVHLELDLVIHTVDVKHVSHEQLHIQGFREVLTDVLTNYLSLSFPNEDLCLTLTRVMAQPPFAAGVTNRMRKESNRRLGCTRDGLPGFSSR